LGQPVIVDNIPAAGGKLAAVRVARAEPDGHTLLLTHQGIAAINPHLYLGLGYDALRDFVPVARFGVGALVLVVPSASPLASTAELLALGKARPDALNFGTPGKGSPPHMAAVQFMSLGNFTSTHVPYNGGGAMMNALLAGQVDWAMESLTAALAQVKAGRLRALAVTTIGRDPALPGTPTLAEAGVLGYQYLSWTGLAAPAHTPATVTGQLNREINALATSDEGRRWFRSSASEAGAQSQAEFAAFVQAEYTKLGSLVRSAGMRAE
jgi:tripartite-type tricarboxylate transporter receptor subunit TctC